MADERDLNTETTCVNSPDRLGHEPDFQRVTTDWDGDQLYVDVSCRFCGRSGCLGTFDALSKQVCW